LPLCRVGMSEFILSRSEGHARRNDVAGASSLRPRSAQACPTNSIIGRPSSYASIVPGSHPMLWLQMSAFTMISQLPARRTCMWVRRSPGASRKYRFVRSGLSARKTNPRLSIGSRNASRGSKALTDIWMSTIGLASKPGIEVAPMWSIRNAVSPNALRRAAPSLENRTGHSGS